MRRCSASPLLTSNRTRGSNGERFPTHGGIPDMRHPEDLTGANGKYNRLYEFIGDSMTTCSALAALSAVPTETPA